MKNIKQIVSVLIIAGLLTGITVSANENNAENIRSNMEQNDTMKIRSENTNSDSQIMETSIVRPGIEMPEQDVSDKDDLIIRNNNIKVDYDYNNSHYYTSKVLTKNITIPDNYQTDDYELYFLVEEGNYYNYYPMMKDEMAIGGANDEVRIEEEYNYKKINYIGDKEEYVLNNDELVEDFDQDNNHNLRISLIAENTDGEITLLSNMQNLNIANKEQMLNTLINKNLSNNYYYYNIDIEEYLQTIKGELNREEFSILLEDAEAEINNMLNEVKNNKENIIENISLETDFNNYYEDFNRYNERETLLNNIQRGIKNEIKKIETFDYIDEIFNR